MLAQKLRHTCSLVWLKLAVRSSLLKLCALDFDL
jgi:hypothetical protein